MRSNPTLDTAARFGEIPFVDFTRDLVTGVFDSLIQAHMDQMEQYAELTSSLTDDLSTYINNTQGQVSFEDIAAFVTNYPLPTVDAAVLNTALGQLQAPATTAPATTAPAIAAPNANQPAEAKTWWGGLINALAPAAATLASRVRDPNATAGLNALERYNNQVLAGTEIGSRTVPTYQEIRNAIAALICSNKYGILQTMVRQGAMRLVVTEGEIETKITFSTWSTAERTRETSNRNRDVQASAGGSAKGINLGLFASGKASRNRQRTVTVNTAKSYQRDTSGTKVDIFGRVLIRFKTDYAPLNG